MKRELCDLAPDIFWARFCAKTILHNCSLQKGLPNMPVTDEKVVTKLRQLLQEVDMETTTGLPCELSPALGLKRLGRLIRVL